MGGMGGTGGGEIIGDVSDIDLFGDKFWGKIPAPRRRRSLCWAVSDSNAYSLLRGERRSDADRC